MDQASLFEPPPEAKQLYILWTHRGNRWVPNQENNWTPEQAEIANEHVANCDLEWKPKASARVYTIRRE